MPQQRILLDLAFLSAYACLFCTNSPKEQLVHLLWLTEANVAARLQRLPALPAVTYFLRQNRAPSSLSNTSSNSPPNSAACRAATVAGELERDAKNFAILDPESVDFNEFSSSQVDEPPIRPHFLRPTRPISVTYFLMVPFLNARY